MHWRRKLNSSSKCVYIEVSSNGGTLKSSIFGGCCIINHPAVGVHHFRKPIYRRGIINMISLNMSNIKYRYYQHIRNILIDPFQKYIIIWRFPEMGVPLNHPFIDACSIIDHPFWDTPMYGNPLISSTCPIYYISLVATQTSSPRLACAEPSSCSMFWTCGGMLVLSQTKALSDHFRVTIWPYGFVWK